MNDEYRRHAIDMNVSRLHQYQNLEDTMASRKTYEIGDNYIVLLDAAEKLDSRAESDEDCLGTLCGLSGVGEWGIDKNGRRVYSAALDEN